MSNSVRPHSRQPTRLLHPWESPGKNTRVGCHFLLQCMHACDVASIVSDSVWPHGQQPTRLLCPQDSLGKSTGVGCHFLKLQIIMIKLKKKNITIKCLCDPQCKMWAGLAMVWRVGPGWQYVQCDSHQCINKRSFNTCYDYSYLWLRHHWTLTLLL